MYKSLLAVSVLAASLAAPLAAHAFEAGDIIVRAGAVTVDPREDSGNIKIGGASQAGTGATLDSDTQLGLNFAYMITDHWAVELLAATPFSHDIGTKGLGGLKLGETKHLPPTLSAVYYPLDKNNSWQPYVGLGINYTAFFDTKLSGQAKDAGFHGLSLDNSWGVAAQIGMDYMLTENLMINAQFRYIDIDTNGQTRTADGTKVKVDVDVDPRVYMIGLGYRF